MQRLEQVRLQANANCEYPFPFWLKNYVHNKSNEEGGCSGIDRVLAFCRGGRVKIRVSCIGAEPCFCAAPRAIKSLKMRTDEKAIYRFPELLEMYGYILPLHRHILGRMKSRRVHRKCPGARRGGCGASCQKCDIEQKLALQHEQDVQH
jgi:hypothetical protein